MLISRGLSALCIFMMTAGALTGCRGAEPAGPDALTPQQTTSEYRAEAATLTLAPHWGWPHQPIPATASDGSGNVYQPGFGKQAADHYWFCSWSQRALDPGVPPRLRREALQQVVQIRSKYYYTEALADDSRPIVEETLRSAELGDFSRLQRDVRLNCPRSGRTGR